MTAKRDRRETRILIRANDEEVRRLDDLRHAYGDFPTRSEIIRRAVERLHHQMCGERSKRVKAAE